MKGEGIRAIIIDDEQGCVTNLEYYLSKLCPDLSVIARGNTMDEARQIMHNNKFDVAYLDIGIFGHTIFNLLQDIGNINFKIVFVTAHEHYAIKAIKMGAIDYILKPLSEQEIVHSYDRIKKRFIKGSQYQEKPSTHIMTNSKTVAERKIVLSQGGKVYIVKMEDVYYLRAKGSYTQVFFNLNGDEKSVVLSKSINQVEKENNYEALYRVHKSFIINTNKIKNILKKDGLSIQISNDEWIPVAKRRVNTFLSFLNKNN